MTEQCMRACRYAKHLMRDFKSETVCLQKTGNETLRDHMIDERKKLARL